MNALLLFFLCLDPDPNFGVNGHFTLDLPNLEVSASGFGPAGETYLAGIQNPETAEQTLVVARVTAAGLLDTAWGNGGLTQVPMSGTPVVGTLVPVDDGSLYVVGSFVMRLDAMGARDTAFGGGGLVELNTQAYGNTHEAAVYAGNRLVLIGKRGFSGVPFLNAFLADGSVDTGFTGAGIIDPLDSQVDANRTVTDMTRTPDGTTVFTLGSRTTPDFNDGFDAKLIRIDPSGAFSQSAFQVIPPCCALGYSVGLSHITYHPTSERFLYSGTSTIAEAGSGHLPNHWRMPYLTDGLSNICPDVLSIDGLRAIRVDEAGRLLLFGSYYLDRRIYNPDHNGCSILQANPEFGVAGLLFWNSFPDGINEVSEHYDGTFLVRNGNNVTRLTEPAPCSIPIQITGPGEEVTICLAENPNPRLELQTDQPNHKIIGTYWLKDGAAVDRQSRRLFLSLAAEAEASGTYRCLILHEDCRNGIWSDPIQVTIAAECGEPAPADPAAQGEGPK